MDHYDKVEQMDQKSIHEEVMMFLGDEVSRIHNEDVGSHYNIEQEYSKTKKNKSPFSLLVLLSCFIVVAAIAFFVSRVIKTHDQEIEVSVEEFDGLNLKNLIDSVSKVQANYDNAVKTKSQLETDLEMKIKAADESMNNDIYVVDSMKLDDKALYSEKIKALKTKRDNEVAAARNQYEPQIAQIQKEIAEYKNQLEEFDAAKVESARESEKLLNSERQVHQMEMEKQQKQYEQRITALENQMDEIQQKNTEEMRTAVKNIADKYQDEIDQLDPTLTDFKASAIILDAHNNKAANFAGWKNLSENQITEEKFTSEVEKYQEIYDDYRYLHDAVAAIPQKHSIPGYVSASKNLVNQMGQAYIETNVEYYQEKTRLNGEIDSLNEQIVTMKNQFETEKADMTRRFETEKANQKSYYENSMEKLLNAAHANAFILRKKLLLSSDSEGSEETQKYELLVYVKNELRAELPAEGVPAEFKNGKVTVKGLVKPDGKGNFLFETGVDNKGRPYPIDYTILEEGTTVKISL